MRGFWGTGEDRELLVLGMCACVIGLLQTCASLLCHEIITEQMPSSSPRGLVQVLSMVLLSALSSEHFLTWLLNLPWAGTWHGAALAPEVLAFLRTTCHRAWPRSAPGEGEAKRSAVAPCTPAVPLLRGLRGRARAAGAGPGGQSSARVKLEAAGSCGTRAGLAGASRSALGKLGSCCSWKNLHSPWSWSGCQQGPVWGPGGRESQLGSPL